MKTIHEKLAATGRAWDLIVAAVENTGVTVNDVSVTVHESATSVSLGGHHDGTVGLDWRDANALVAALPTPPLGWAKPEHTSTSGGVSYDYWCADVAGITFTVRVVARALTVVGDAR